MQSMLILFSHKLGPCLFFLPYSKIDTNITTLVQLDAEVCLIIQKALGFYDVVFDAVYAPKVTRLLREAEECGVKVVSGVEMFIRQAMGQFEHFTGGIEGIVFSQDIVNLLHGKSFSTYPCY
jgi:hypothetical protein